MIEYNSVAESYQSEGDLERELINDLQNLLEAIIHTVATAIDAKSPYTGGHVRKVAVVGSMIAEAVSACQEGRYKDVHYSADELDQIRIAGLLHDIGKITPPEYVRDKATKLETIHDRIESIVPRFDAIKARVELGYAQRELEALRAGQAYDRTAQQQALQQELEALDDDRAFLEQANIGGEFMSDAAVARVRQIGARMWQHDGYREPLLTDDEIMNLTVRKGTLTDAERQVINDHVRLSIEMLEGLPFPKKLARVPEIGGNHHEKLNGQGYPRGLNAEQLSLEARILALADIFEALTSSDRPYKKAKPLSEVRRILGFMAKDYELDPDLLDFFYQQGLDVRFARQELTPEQLDIEEP